MIYRLKADNGSVLGYFTNVAVKSDRLVCDGCEFPFSVIGSNYVLDEVDELPPLPFDRKAACVQLDEAVIAIYSRPMLLSKEYEAREAAAQAYKTAGYSGTVPGRVAGFATPAGLSFRAAADMILAQAAQLRGALDMLSDLRMQKYAITNTLDDAAARTLHEATMASVAQIAAALN